MKRFPRPAIWAVLVLVLTWSGLALAQNDYLECGACQLMLKLVDSSVVGSGKNIVVDATKQCGILAPGDRKACVDFYAAYGPKFIKALKERQVKGQSLEGICKEIGYCG
jgi:hypothetical protein